MPVGLTTPRLVTLLGALGIVPFGLAIAWPDPLAGERIFQTYSLAILCFLAGSWWTTTLLVGRKVHEKRLLLMSSNLIVLLGLGIVLFDVAGAMLGLAALFGVLLLGEYQFAVFSRQPEYYRKMRTGVTLVVILLHGFGWLMFNP